MKKLILMLALVVSFVSVSDAQLFFETLYGENHKHLRGGTVNGYNYAMQINVNPAIVAQYTTEWQKKLNEPQTAKPLAKSREMNFELEDDAIANQLKTELSKMGFDLDVSNIRIPVLKGVPEYAEQNKVYINIVEDYLANCDFSDGDFAKGLKDSLAVSIARSAAFIENKSKIDNSVLGFISKYNLGDPRSQTDKQDDDESVFTHYLTLRSPYHNANGLGAAVCPVKMHMKFEIDFSSKGAVIGYRFLDEEVFYNVTQIYKSRFKGQKPLANIMNKEDADSLEADMVLTAWNSSAAKGITAVLLVMNDKMDKAKEFAEMRDKFYNDINGRFKLYDALVQKYPANVKWGSDRDIIDEIKKAAEANDLSPACKIYQTWEKEVYDEDKLMNLTPYQVENTYKKHFFYIFHAFASELSDKLDCQITGVMEDGKITWQLYDGKCLPVDPALRKKLAKKGIDYYSYISE